MAPSERLATTPPTWSASDSTREQRRPLGGRDAPVEQLRRERAADAEQQVDGDVAGADGARMGLATSRMAPPARRGDARAARARAAEPAGDGRGERRSGGVGARTRPRRRCRRPGSPAPRRRAGPRTCPGRAARCRPARRRAGRPRTISRRSIGSPNPSRRPRGWCSGPRRRSPGRPPRGSPLVRRPVRPRQHWPRSSTAASRTGTESPMIGPDVSDGQIAWQIAGSEAADHRARARGRAPRPLWPEPGPGAPMPRGRARGWRRRTRRRAARNRAPARSRRGPSRARTTGRPARPRPRPATRSSRARPPTRTVRRPDHVGEAAGRELQGDGHDPVDRVRGRRSRPGRGRAPASAGR